jgi:hypothetical protein
MVGRPFRHSWLDEMTTRSQELPGYRITLRCGGNMLQEENEQEEHEQTMDGVMSSCPMSSCVP